MDSLVVVVNGDGKYFLGVILSDHDSVKDATVNLLKFFEHESCGQCTPCRVGGQRARQILTNISEGVGKLEDIETLDNIAAQLFELSNCGLGQTAGVPIRDILRHFRAEVEAHIKLRVCPTGACSMSGRQVRVA